MVESVHHRRADLPNGARHALICSDIGAALRSGNYGFWIFILFVGPLLRPIGYNLGSAVFASASGNALRYLERRICVCAVLFVGGALWTFEQSSQLVWRAEWVWALSVLVCAFALSRNWRRTALRWARLIADRAWVGNPVQLAKPWVVDGDTITDAEIIYRLANIDAPETGGNANCYRERSLGEAAKWAAIHLVRGAREVTVRPTARRDKYNRIVAFVFVDGEDLGELLMARGLSRAWRGSRSRWCGAAGGLAKLAAVRGERFKCATCARR
jgi:micrococcal nuclease